MMGRLALTFCFIFIYFSQKVLSNPQSLKAQEELRSAIATASHGGGDAEHPPHTYGQPREICEDVMMYEFKDRCENFTEKLCTTHQAESCSDVSYQKCSHIISTNQQRVCLNVTELVCYLKQQVEYDMVPSTFTVQKCTNVPEQVCDTIYTTELKPKDDYQCISYTNFECSPKEKVVHDKTCKTTTRFECDSSHPHGSAYGQHHGKDIASSPATSSSSASHYGKANVGGECQKFEETTCYDSPRKVRMTECESRTKQVCDKLSSMNPVAIAHQRCHNEKKRICHPEQRQQLRQIRRYVYTKHCHKVGRTLCESVDMKKLIPTCVPSQRKNCVIEPQSEECKEFPRQFCHKYKAPIVKNVCRTVVGYGDNEHEVHR